MDGPWLCLLRFGCRLCRGLAANRDNLQELELSVLRDIDVSRILVRISGLAEGDVSGDIVAVDLGDRILQRLPVNRIPCFNRITDDVVGIKAQRRVSDDGIVAAIVLNPLLVGIEPFLVALDKVGCNRVGIVILIDSQRPRCR